MKILLTTLHAKYSHASLALPSLAACCRDIPGIDTVIRELTVNEPHEKLLRQIIFEKADLIAFSCYIWNIEETLRLVSDIRKIAPDTLIVLGGPEVSFGIFELMSANPAVDHVVKGEGEEVFRKLLTELTGGKNYEIPNLFYRDNGGIASGPLDSAYLTLDSIPSPFGSGLVDLSKPLIYYETSRGCPFSCAFCLSSVDRHVRSFSQERIESDLLFLMRHNVSQIKLVDRTFNYDSNRADNIWKFILENNRNSHFHFEIAADLLTEENMALLRSVPADTFRFEIGIQSASAKTLELVGRTADLERIYANVHRLRKETAIELHLDLVAGLPEENYDGFLYSLQQVANLQPHVIQVEPLKVLKGSPMRKTAEEQGYSYSGFPPYPILSTPLLSFEAIGRIEVIGRLLDLFYNHGGFSKALQLMQCNISFAMLFDRMAGEVGMENLTGRATRRTYELFAAIAKPLLSEGDQHLLHDALFFDYCRKEMPLMGKLPDFIADRQQWCAWPSLRDLPEGLEIPEGCRTKAFSYKFVRDYRGAELRDESATVTFVYVSGAGRGLRVMVI